MKKAATPRESVQKARKQWNMGDQEVHEEMSNLFKDQGNAWQSHIKALLSLPQIENVQQYQMMERLWVHRALPHCNHFGKQTDINDSTEHSCAT